MFTQNINAHGVYTFTSPQGVLVYYKVSNDMEIELCYPTLDSALKVLKVTSVTNITPFKLFSPGSH